MSTEGNVYNLAWVCRKSVGYSVVAIFASACGGPELVVLQTFIASGFGNVSKRRRDVSYRNNKGVTKLMPIPEGDGGLRVGAVKCCVGGVVGSLGPDPQVR